MRSMHDTITRLNALRNRMPSHRAHQADDRLTPLTDFGTNPGALLARTYVPPTLCDQAPLVVVLHGCTQSASSYNRGAAWTDPANEFGFALLFPEQQRANNPNLCFNWFTPDDASRGQGEALSIVQMVRAMCRKYAIDEGRVFVTGLSAGGAMTAVMLATYPDVFAGGAVIAGLPFGTATSVPEAFDRMRGHSGAKPDELTSLVRAASSHAGEWPSLSVWHGSGDQTVDASNAAALVDQWRGLHGVAAEPSSTERVAGHLRRVWLDDMGSSVIEENVIADMGHGTPIHVSEAVAGETAGPYMLDVGISSTRELVKFWTLDDRRAQPSTSVAQPSPTPAASAKPPMQSAPARATVHPARPVPHVQQVIERALRSAGLMR